MKNVLLLAGALLLCTSILAQNLPTPTKWKIRKIGVSFGTDMDMVNGMDFDYIMASAKGLDNSQYKNVEFQSDMFAGVCENPNIRVFAALDVPGLKNTELNLGLSAVFNRYDGVYYHTEDVETAIINNEFDYLSVHTMTSELALEGSLAKRVTLLNFLNLYGGVGTNIGYTFSGDMTISGNQYQTVKDNLDRSNSDIASGTVHSDYVYESYDAKDAIHQRAFLQLGVGIILFKRLEVGFDLRRGVGYRATLDGPFRGTNLESASFGAKWILR